MTITRQGPTVSHMHNIATFNDEASPGAVQRLAIAYGCDIGSPTASPGRPATQVRRIDVPSNSKPGWAYWTVTLRCQHSQTYPLPKQVPTWETRKSACRGADTEIRTSHVDCCVTVPWPGSEYWNCVCADVIRSSKCLYYWCLHPKFALCRLYSSRVSCRLHTTAQKQIVTVVMQMTVTVATAMKAANQLHIYSQNPSNNDI